MSQPLKTLRANTAKDTYPSGFTVSKTPAGWEAKEIDTSRGSPSAGLEIFKFIFTFPLGKCDPTKTL
jgi:hypothetical protein